MLTQVLTIARNTFVESIRQPIFFVVVMLSGVAMLFTTWTTGFSMGYSSSAEVSGDNQFLLGLALSTVFLCGMVLAALTATAVVSREIDNKTVLTVVSKPVARPTVILGKYVGVAAAILIAVVIMLVFMLMGIRHEVMTTAADQLDGPVMVFTGAAVAIAIFVGVWCNFFYGWYFSQTAMVLMAPLAVLAYLLVLLFSKKWQVQSLATDFKPQILTASAGVALAIMVLTALATAVSTRLGQVMTIVVCLGVFLLGLMSNYLIGRHVFSNQIAGQIAEFSPERVEQVGWDRPGDTAKVRLANPPRVPIIPGASFYYAASPSGFPMEVAEFPPFEGNVAQGVIAAPHPGLVVTAVDGQVLTVRRAGEGELRISRPPQARDYLFLRPTEVNPWAMALWSALPNLHYFWLVDAVTQNNPVPLPHLGMLAGYALLQTGALLCLAVVLFQRRDVG